MPLAERITFRTTLKSDWQQYCRQNGVRPSAALRQLMHKILTGGTHLDQILNMPIGILPSSENNQPKNRIEIRLTKHEYATLVGHAKQAGVSPAKWLITLVRYQFIQHTPLTVLELDKLDERLYQVRMIGHHLNQVARALNSHELHPSQIELMPTLQLLMQNLDAEKQALRTIFNHNLKRW
ncbi:MAG: hypothetical protein CTY12_01080 [Methylotenera sp.]|nr:MAG: hypothetical protein CTY12_01080 [Methylotenera sp.]